MLIPPPAPSVVHMQHLLSLAVKSMQRAFSSNTLSTVALSDTVSHSHHPDPQHDGRQPLSHSQSMFLPDNGKVNGCQSTVWQQTDAKKDMQKI